jgi:6-phosphogluconolactonase
MDCEPIPRMGVVFLEGGLLMERQMKVLGVGAQFVQGLSAWIVGRLQQSIQNSGRATISLAGGSTPKVVYEALASANLPWEHLHIFWGDERYVPPTDPASNEGMVRQAWLDKVAIPAGNIHPWPTAAGSPELAATAYQQVLVEFFGVHEVSLKENRPQFDLVLLGMGEDGHTASLFPHDLALQATGLTAVGSKGGEPRLTLTAEILNQAHCVAFVVTGAAKQPALQQVLASTGDDSAYPARLIRPQGELWWWLDEAAAAGQISEG